MSPVTREYIMRNFVLPVRLEEGNHSKVVDANGKLVRLYTSPKVARTFVRRINGPEVKP